MKEWKGLSSDRKFISNGSDKGILGSPMFVAVSEQTSVPSENRFYIILKGRVRTLLLRVRSRVGSLSK